MYHLIIHCLVLHCYIITFTLTLHCFILLPTTQAHLNCYMCLHKKYSFIQHNCILNTTQTQHNHIAMQYYKQNSHWFIQYNHIHFATHNTLHTGDKLFFTCLWNYIWIIMINKYTDAFEYNTSHYFIHHTAAYNTLFHLTLLHTANCPLNLLHTTHCPTYTAAYNTLSHLHCCIQHAVQLIRLYTTHCPT